MIFHMEADGLKNIPTDLNGMTEVGFGLNCPLLHIWNKSPVRESNTNVLLHTRLHPLTSPLRNVAMRNAHTIVQTHLPKLHVFHFAITRILGQYIMRNKLKILLSIVLIHHPIMHLKVCKPSSINFLHETTWHVKGFSFPSHLHILVNTIRLGKFPLTTIWKCLWVNALHFSQWSTTWQYNDPR